MTREGEQQNSNPEKTQSHNLIERLSMYTETLCKSEEDTLAFLHIAALFGTTAAMYSYFSFESNNQLRGLIFAGVAVVSAAVIVSGFAILSKQLKKS